MVRTTVAKLHKFMVLMTFIPALISLLFLIKGSLYQNDQTYKTLQASKLGVSVFSGKRNRIRQQSSFTKDSNMELVNMNTNISCERWAVVTTVFKASDAVRKVACDPAWCLVVVGDMNSPEKDEYMTDLGSVDGTITVFLWPDEQEWMFPLLSHAVPWNDFSRKNIGYMYAIKHGAQWIWDFDDDNMNMLPENFFKNANQYKTPCSEFLFHIFNPYPYFSVNETYVWPRGQPLEHIRNSETIPDLCDSSERKSIAVVQSLANIEPDVDAIYRFTRNTPFNFGASPSSHFPVVVPRNAFSPFNAQATLWAREAFLYLALPISVSCRVNDIWRSYIAQYFFHKQSLYLMFVPPYVDQYRNFHDNLKDFNAELDLYQKSGKLLSWLSRDVHVDNIVDLYGEMYEHSYLEQQDLRFIDAWIKTLNAV